MRKLILTLSIAIIGISFYSCKKEKDTIASVLVVNANEQAVTGVIVRLYCPSATCDGSQGQGSLNEDIDRNDVTGSNGKVSFNYSEMYKLGQAGFSVLDIAIYKSEADLAAENPETTGVIKIEEEQENEQTIICQSC